AGAAAAKDDTAGGDGDRAFEVVGPGCEKHGASAGTANVVECGLDVLRVVAVDGFEGFRDADSREADTAAAVAGRGEVHDAVAAVVGFVSELVIRPEVDPLRRLLRGQGERRRGEEDGNALASHRPLL